ncbi:MAG: YcxB family protein [Lachnospiraceae bacterium]|nr:YcxB family protein [Lachnospiraceae bacterium]
MAKLFFENRFILTKKLHREYYRELYRKNGRSIKIISAVLACIFAAAFLLSVILFKSTPAAVLALVLCIYFVLMIPFAYVFREWIGYRGLRRDHQASAIFEIVSFYQDRIHVKVNKTEFDLKYDSLDGLMETKELWVLLLKGKSGLNSTQLLWKKGFTDKSEAGLKAFREFIDNKSKKSIFGAGE